MMSTYRMLTVMLDSEITQNVNSPCLFRSSSPTCNYIHPAGLTQSSLAHNLFPLHADQSFRFNDTEEEVGVVVRRGVCILAPTLEKPDITVQVGSCYEYEWTDLSSDDYKDYKI